MHASKFALLIVVSVTLLTGCTRAVGNELTESTAASLVGQRPEHLSSSSQSPQLHHDPERDSLGVAGHASPEGGHAQTLAPLEANSMQQLHSPLIVAGPILYGTPWTGVQPRSGLYHSNVEVRLEIPQFQHPSPEGSLWGPFQVGEWQFEPKAYPLRMPVFRHLYDHVKVSSLDFEELVDRRRRLTTTGTIFYPEPDRLYAIQVLLWQQLLKLDLRPQRVEPSPSLLELQWIWPPTAFVPSQAGLEIPSILLQRRFRRAIDTRLVTHLLPDPNMFHLEVPTADGGTRHILMTPAKARPHLVMRFSPPRSSFWFFYEGVKHDGVKKLAFLGAMFLPSATEQNLLMAGVIRPAFT